MPPFFYFIANQKKYNVNVNSVNVNKKILDIGMCRGYDESIEHRREKNSWKTKKNQ